ncbi:MAG: hypothetical protein H6737_03280 [Alphaproteobacteria bacterium]|nr:hypothetical protein [Alphaproteobacteria bacterium]
MRLQNPLTALSAGLVVTFSLACYGGASLDGNDAGSDGWLDHVSPVGSEIDDLVGDGRCDWLGRPYVTVSVERVYTMLYSDHTSDCTTTNQADRKVVWALHPSIGAQPIVDVSGLEDVRLLDTSEGMLLMGEYGDTEHLWRIDHDDLSVLAEETREVRYWGTRTSPSRRWVAAGDNRTSDLDLHLIDPRTLESVRVDDDAVWAEAMWMKAEDVLAAIFFDASLDQARIEMFDFRGADTADALVTSPRLTTFVQGVSPNFFVSYTWIGIDPAGRYAVFPVHGNDSGQSLLIVVDVRDGTSRIVEGVDGPLRFTPDGSTIVGWSIAQPGTLVLVDPVTLETTPVDLPLNGTPEYVMGFGGSQLLVANAMGGEDLVIYDIDADSSIVLPVAASLQTFTTRDEQVWMIESGQLWRIDMDDETADAIDLGWTPRHVVWAPQSDLLFLDDAQAPRVRFMDPDTLGVVHSEVLQPDAQPALDLSVRAVLEREDREITAATRL